MSPDQLPDGRGPDLASVALVVVRRWRLIFRLTALAFVVGIVHALVATPEYVATASFTVAETRPSASLGLGALAGQFGGSLAALAGVPTSAQFLRAALTSRDVLNQLLDHRIVLVADTGNPDRSAIAGDSLDLLEWYHTRHLSSGLAVEDGRKELLQSIETAVGDRTGIVSLVVKERDPRVAASVAVALVAALNRFNIETRHTSSRANRAFLEQRVKDAQGELRDAENEMRDFISHNRRVNDSPNLQFEEGRLQRVITVRQQVYLSLAQDLEQARIDEVKDTPVLTMMEVPVPPARRSWPKRTLLVIAWAVTGAIVGVGFAFLQDWTGGMDRRGTPAWVELRASLARLSPRRR